MKQPSKTNNNYLWTQIRRVFFLLIKAATRKVMLNRLIVMADGSQIRWLKFDLDRFLHDLEIEAEALRPIAALGKLTQIGNRLLVELTILTIAANYFFRKKARSQM